MSYLRSTEMTRSHRYDNPFQLQLATYLKSARAKAVATWAAGWTSPMRAAYSDAAANLDALGGSVSDVRCIGGETPTL